MNLTASSVRFSELSGLLERISISRKSSDKQALLKSFISKWREYSTNSASVEICSFYPAMRLIIPSMDKSRPAYGIKEHTLAKLICNILCLGTTNPDAIKLINFKSTHSKSRDFAEMAFGVLKNRTPSKCSITIEEINNRLNNIAEANGQSKKELIEENLIFLFQNTNALDQKWIIRILLKDLSLGLSVKSIFQCFHPSSENYYNVSTDLEAVCSKFSSEPIATTDSFDIELFQPFRPMLSERADLDQLRNSLGHRPLIHESKLDGERVQMHKHGSNYRYWSRNGLEWTASYGSGPSAGSLTPFIHAQFRDDVDSCILDGEMMGHCAATGTMVAKAMGTGFDAKRPRTGDQPAIQPFFVVFDVLQLNERSLIGWSLRHRKHVLDREVLRAALPGRIEILTWTEVTGLTPCLTAFDEALDAGYEGLVIKRPDSLYQVNIRTGGWFKLKPDYVLGLQEEMDCVIVGGYFSRRKLIRHFLCAVKSCENGSDRYLSFVRVGTGFTRQVLYEFNMRVSAHWKAYNKASPPDWLVLAGRSREAPDLYIEPQNSFIIQVKAAEIIPSDNYAAGFTLRFARIDRFREDKCPVADCMTLDELTKLRTARKGKLVLRPLEEMCSTEPVPAPPRTRKQAVRKTKRPAVAENFKSSVPVKMLRTSMENNSMFGGKEFCILISDTSDSICDKKEMEMFVHDNGGSVVQNPSERTFAVVVNTVTLKVKNIMKSDRYDIISSDWIVECKNQNRYVEPKPRDFLCMKRETAKYLSSLYDEAGDSYTEELSLAHMRLLLQHMEEKSIKVPQMSPGDKANFLDEVMIEDLDFLYVNGCVIHFHECPPSRDCSQAQISRIERYKNLLRLGGAQISQDLHQASTTHVVMIDCLAEPELAPLRTLNRQRPLKFYLISFQWAVDTVQARIRLAENHYFL